jgi:hypothetical protein
MFESKHVCIMAEHGCDGVWEPGGSAGDLEALPISVALKDRFGSWISEYGKLVDPVVTQRRGLAPFNIVSFAMEGLAIANAVKAELPDWKVEYFDEVQKAWTTAILNISVIRGLPMPPPPSGTKWTVLGSWQHSDSQGPGIQREMDRIGAQPSPSDFGAGETADSACCNSRIQEQPAAFVSPPLPTTPVLSAEDHQ